MAEVGSLGVFYWMSGSKKTTPTGSYIRTSKFPSKYLVAEEEVTHSPAGKICKNARIPFPGTL